MRKKLPIMLLAIVSIVSCNKNQDAADTNILFLHQSTGEIIWQGKEISLITRAARRISPRLAKIITRKGKLEKLIEDYNEDSKTNYQIEELRFPKNSGNYPFHYYNLWVKHAGDNSYEGEPTLEMLTKDYQVIIFKHCYPVSNIKADQDSAEINSRLMTISNYKLQYMALKEKLHQFPSVKFILFTGAVQVKANITDEEAKRAREFFTWVRDEWDESGDNIFLWDLYSLQTEGGLYFRDEYATSPDNSHPNEHFASEVVKLLYNRIIDVIENEGDETFLTGKEK